MNNSLLTNTLLVVIAALLLVLVIQNSLHNPRRFERPSLGESSYHEMSGEASEMSGHPSLKPDAGSMAHQMVFHALKAFPKGCEGVSTLFECESPAAAKVKAEIEVWAQEGKGPRQIFDAIVAKWGDKVLTEEALRIRNMRVKAP